MKKYSILVLLLLTVMAGCSSERALQALNKVVEDNHFKKTPDLSYGAHVRQRMDLYQPVAASTPDEASIKPLIVFVHGGAWRTGSKDDYAFVAASLTRKGYSVLIPNYRLYPNVQFPDFITDIADAISAYEKMHVIPADQASPKHQTIVLMGHSSGAHQVALLTTDTSYFREAKVASKIVGLIGISGPYNLPLENEEVSAVFPNIGDEQSVNPVLQLQKMSAENPSSIPPTLLLHGEDDERVTIKHTQEFAKELRNSGATVTVEILRGGHARAVVALAGPLEFLNDSLVAVERFLARISVAE